MKCLLCGYAFDEQQAQRACTGCILARRCDRIRCPNCGYETVPAPRWLKKIVDRRKQDDADREG